MKKLIIATILLAGSAFAGPRISVGIGFGAPVPIVRPVCPGPGYAWVDGYYGPAGVWIPGFWRAPVVGVGFGPRYFEPRYVAPRYFTYENRREFHPELRHDFRR